MDLLMFWLLMLFDQKYNYTGTIQLDGYYFTFTDNYLNEGHNSFMGFPLQVTTGQTFFNGSIILQSNMSKISTLEACNHEIEHNVLYASGISNTTVHHEIMDKKLEHYDTCDKLMEMLN